MAEIFEKPKTFTKEWFSYVWDYYKWYIIVGIAVVALALFTYADMRNTVKYDTNINFVSTGVVGSDKAELIAGKCAENSADLNNNGRVDISFTQLNFTEDNQNNSEMNFALMNKLTTLFASDDELIFIVDSHMHEKLMKMSYAHDIFLKSSEWISGDVVRNGEYAVSLANSSVLHKTGVDSSDWFIMVARKDYEEGLKPEEENAIRIAEFLIK